MCCTGAARPPPQPAELARGGHRAELGLDRIASELGRQALHARVLGFEHPVTGKALHFESEPPADFSAALGALRRWAAAPAGSGADEQLCAREAAPMLSEPEARPRGIRAADVVTHLLSECHQGRSTLDFLLNA
jgi:hypothetical protein